MTAGSSGSFRKGHVSNTLMCISMAIGPLIILETFLAQFLRLKGEKEQLDLNAALERERQRENKLI